MTAVNQRAVGHDDVYEAGSAVDGGQMVVPANGTAVNPGKQLIGPAGDAAKNCLGVAFRKAIPVGSQADLTFNDPDGYPAVFGNEQVNELTTVYKRRVVAVTYTAAAVGFGAKLACAANGAVRAWVSADGPDAIVGECRVVGGMSAAGGTGFAYIY